MTQQEILKMIDARIQDQKDSIAHMTLSARKRYDICIEGMETIRDLVADQAKHKIKEN